jgi:abortive infection bacteriophage resistance protein
MSKVPYTKPALSYADQLLQLKSRGYIIYDETAFLHLLQIKSYYRLSGYWYPQLDDKQNHIFKPGANFDTAWQIYLFDKELRQLVVSQLEKIEIAIRAKMIYIFSHQFGPFWYTNPNLFSNVNLNADTLAKITDEFNRSDAPFVRSFKKKYSDPLPPCWTAFEIISFGSISKLFTNFKPGRSKREVADWFGLDDTTFSSWIHSLVYVRNVCAHHSRLWNRVMRIQPVNPLTPQLQWLNNHEIANNRTYFILTMIVYLLQTVDDKQSMITNFKNLLAKYPNIFPPAMGFPVNWQDEPLWN